VTLHAAYDNIITMLLMLKLLHVLMLFNFVTCLRDQYEHGDDQTLAAVVKMMPNKVKRRRKIQTESGVGEQFCESCADIVLTAGEI